MKPTSQTEKLHNLLKDYRPHRSDEILITVYGVPENGGPSCANLTGRISDVRKKYGVKIKCWRDQEKKRLWVYQMLKPKPVTTQKDLFVITEQPYENCF